VAFWDPPSGSKNRMFYPDNLRRDWPTAVESGWCRDCTSRHRSSEVPARRRGTSSVACSHTAAACPRRYSREWRQRATEEHRTRPRRKRKQAEWLVRSRSCRPDRPACRRDRIPASCRRSGVYLTTSDIRRSVQSEHCDHSHPAKYVASQRRQFPPGPGVRTDRTRPLLSPVRVHPITGRDQVIVEIC